MGVGKAQIRLGKVNLRKLNDKFTKNELDIKYKINSEIAYIFDICKKIAN